MQRWRPGVPAQAYTRREGPAIGPQPLLIIKCWVDLVRACHLRQHRFKRLLVWTEEGGGFPCSRQSLQQFGRHA